RGDAHIAGEDDIDARMLEHQVDERRGGRFALGARDGDDRAAVTVMRAPKVEVGRDRDSRCPRGVENRFIERNAGAFDDGAEAGNLLGFLRGNEGRSLDFGNTIVAGYEQVEL